MREYIDFHHVPNEQSDIHNRLNNWKAWVVPRPPSWVSPMFRQYKSKAFQWHAPEYRHTCDTLDALRVERTISRLPRKHRDAIRWHYVICSNPTSAQRQLGVGKAELNQLVIEGRSMLKNMLHSEIECAI
jgi:DNA-directed RNA polymerase specialized sigma24 family protein